MTRRQALSVLAAVTAAALPIQIAAQRAPARTPAIHVYEGPN